MASARRSRFSRSRVTGYARNESKRLGGQVHFERGSLGCYWERCAEEAVWEDQCAHPGVFPWRRSEAQSYTEKRGRAAGNRAVQRSNTCICESMEEESRDRSRRGSYGCSAESESLFFPQQA